jgi:hypothetical protein
MADTQWTHSLEEAAKQVKLPHKVVLVLAQLDARALGVACGLVLGLWLWLATIVLVIRGGPAVGRNLSLLSQYFVGFRVSLVGSVLALAYGCAAGFLAGYLFARLRNYAVHTYLLYIKRRAERAAMADMLDGLM